MPNLRLGGKDAPVASKNSLSSFAFKTASLSVSLKTNLFPFCPSPRFAVDALSADRFLRMIFNLPPEELDTTMHSPGEYIKQAISTESDVRGSSTTNVSATCILRARDSGQNSFDVRRVKLLLQTQPDVYYGCLNGKFFCVPVLVNIHHHHHRAAGEKRVTPILITQYRVPSFDQESPPWKSILHIVRKMIDRRRAFRSRAGDWFYPGGEKNRCNFSVGVAWRENIIPIIR